MQNEFSFEFLSCLKDYRNKFILLKSFRSWRKYINMNNKKYKKSCGALEFWSSQTMKKCFRALRGSKGRFEPCSNDFTKSLYLMILAATTFLPEKTFIVHGYRIDKIISLFKQVRKPIVMCV